MMGLARSAREWPRAWREEGRVAGREEGRREGRRVGQVELLRAQAVGKFGDAAAATLVRRLEQVEDPNDFVEVGRWILECSAASELLRRLDGLGDGAG